MAHTTSMADGSFDWSGGVDSTKVPTIQSELTPNGLPRNTLAWLINGSVRDGGISPRAGWKRIRRIQDRTGYFQGGYMYQPSTGNPYIVCSISGHIIKVVPDEPPVDLSISAFQTVGTPPSFVLLRNTTAGPIGTVVPAGVDPVLGAYGSFTIPPVGSVVRVPITNPYTGSIGAPLSLGPSVTHSFLLQGQTHRWAYHNAVHTAPVDANPLLVHSLNVAACPGSVPADLGLHDFVFQTINPYEKTVHDEISPGFGPQYWFCLKSVFPPDKVGFFPFVDDLGPVGGVIDVGIVQSVMAPPASGNWVGLGDYNIVTDLGVTPGTWTVLAAGSVGGINPSTASTGPRSYFEQAEQFLVIQAGDGVTLPLFWDGLMLRRSIGINNTAVAPGTPGVNEIPAATAMDYYMGRLWYAQGRTYSAGDIVKGGSGTLAYSFLDAVLNVTENPLCVGGDGFTIPTASGNITALNHNANLDASLGQGQLFPFTEKAIYSLSVPLTRTNWIAAGNNTQPLQAVVQLSNGAVNDTCVVPVNGDLYYQSVDPAVRSLITAVRQFPQPGNLPISAAIERLFRFTDRSLLTFANGIYFNNRLIVTAMPALTPQGTIHQALAVLDFDPVSTSAVLQGQRLPPAWEGMYEGLDFLQLFTGIFDNEEKAYAIVVSKEDQGIDLWELTKDDKVDDVDNRITWITEFPAFNWGKEFELKDLFTAELWIDRVFGEVTFLMEYRADGDPCWQNWHEWQFCSSRNSCEDVVNPICYPLVPNAESYKSSVTLPKPPAKCETTTGRMSNIAYQFQCRLTVKGFCRIRGFLLHAGPVDKQLYDGMVC